MLKSGVLLNEIKGSASNSYFFERFSGYWGISLPGTNATNLARTSRNQKEKRSANKNKFKARSTKFKTNSKFKILKFKTKTIVRHGQTQTNTDEKNNQ
jgi:hypothetical protein